MASIKISEKIFNFFQKITISCL